MLVLLYPDHPTLGATLPYGPWWHSFVLEVFLTAVLVYAVLSVSAADESIQPLAGVVFGAIIGLEAMFAGPISGASMNPARSLAPAVVSGQARLPVGVPRGPDGRGLVAYPPAVFSQKPGCCPNRRRSVSESTGRKVRVLFVCVENSNRSQMAQAFAAMYGGDRVEAYPPAAGRAGGSTRRRSRRWPNSATT